MFKERLIPRDEDESESKEDEDESESEEDEDERYVISSDEDEDDGTLTTPTQRTKMRGKIKLDDFFYTYPNKDDEKFQQKITDKYEFNSLGLDEKAKILPNPITGNFKHQELIHRYMLTYDKLFLIWEPGVGKTWGSLGSAEKFRKFKEKVDLGNYSYPNLFLKKVNTYIRGCYVIVKNKNLRRTFRKTLYQKNELNGLLSPLMKKKIKNFYRIVTYHGFYKEIRGLSAEHITKNYENYMFIVDEVHNLGPSQGKVKKTELSHKERYKTYLRFFEIVKNVKIMLLSATLMFNKVNEAAYLFNLILPKDKRMSTRESDYVRVIPPNKRKEIPLDIKLIQKDKVLYKYFKSSISYVRALNVGVKIFTRGQDIHYPYEGKINLKNKYFEHKTAHNIKYVDPLTEKLKVEKNVIELSQKVVKCYMTDGVQLKIYNKYTKLKKGEVIKLTPKKIEEDDEGEDFDDDFGEEDFGQTSLMDLENIMSKRSYQPSKVTTIKKSYLSINIEKISLFVFPDESIGNSGIIANSQYVRIYNANGNEIQNPGKNKKWAYLEMTDRFSQEYLNNSKLKNLSVKYDRIIDIIATKRKNKIPGLIYIFFEYKGIGSMLLDAILRKKFGYRRFDKNISFNRKPVNQSTVTLSGDTSGIQNILDSVNHPANYKGEFVEVVIATGALGEGYSINSVVEIIQSESTWNKAKSFQATRRGIRINSFKLLILDAGRKKGLPVDDMTLQTVANRLGDDLIKVNLNLLAVLPYELKTEKGKDAKIDISFDTYRYFVAEKKDWYIKQMEKVMKKSAFDCVIHKSRNEVPESKKYSAECSYGGCRLECFDKAGKTDYKTYNLLYNDVIYGEVLRDVKNRVSDNNVIKIEDLMEELSQKYHLGILNFVMIKILNSEITINDAFGFSKYLYSDCGYLFLNKNYDDRKYNNHVYSDSLVLSQRNDLNQKMRETVEKGLLLVDVEKDDLSILEKSLLLEKSIKVVSSSSGKISVSDEYIINNMRGYYMKLFKPVNMIVEAKVIMLTRTKGSFPAAGYKLLTPAQWRKLKMKYQDDPGTQEEIFIHCFEINNLDPSSRGSGLKRFRGEIPKSENEASESNMMIMQFKKSELVWNRIIDPFQKEIYSHIFQDSFEKVVTDFENKIKSHFTKEKYLKSLERGGSVRPIYIINYAGVKEKKIIIPNWFKSRTVKIKRNIKSGDRRGIPSGTDFEGIKEDIIDGLLSYFGIGQILSSNKRKRDLLFIRMQKLGLVLSWESSMLEF